MSRPRCDCLAGDPCEHPEPTAAEVDAIRAEVREQHPAGDVERLARRVATRRRIADTLRTEAGRLEAEVADLSRRADRMDAQADELEGSP